VILDIQTKKVFIIEIIILVLSEMDSKIDSKIIKITSVIFETKIIQIIEIKLIIVGRIKKKIQEAKIVFKKG